MTSESDPLVGEAASHRPCSKRTWILVSVGAVIFVAAALGTTLGIVLRPRDLGPPTPPYEPTFPYNIHYYNILEHAVRLETFGSRAPGTPGHDLAWAYLASQLAVFDFTVTVQNFTVPVYNQTALPTLALKSADLNLTLVHGTDFVQAEYGGSSPASLADVPLTRVMTSGCLDSDWQTFPSGHVAVLDLDLVMGDGTNCSALEKAQKAEAAHASAVLFRMDSLVSRPVEIPLMDFPWYEGMSAGTTIPAMILAHTAGTVLLDSSVAFTVTLTSESTIRDVVTRNMFAASKYGNEDDTVMIGAHFDSVPAGPGINDNGSGSTSLLELLRAYVESGSYRSISNRVVLAWWGAEEMGLLGSFQFVKREHDAGRLGKVVSYINLDMLGSRNGYPQIHHPDATHPILGLNASLIPGSTFLAEMLESHISRAEYTALAPNSDYYPFLAYGVPASGLATGAGELVNSTLALRYGLLENTPCDPCYHRPCDTVLNLDSFMAERLARVAGNTIQSLATQHDLRHYLGLNP